MDQHSSVSDQAPVPRTPAITAADCIRLGQLCSRAAMGSTKHRQPCSIVRILGSALLRVRCNSMPSKCIA